MYPVKSTRMFFGTSAERTAAGLASFLPGDEYYETDTGDTYQHNGTAWTQKNTSGGGTPGGSSGQVQYNDGGAFGGFGLWNNAANQLLIGGATAASATAVFEAHDSIADVRFNVVNDSASNASNVANVGFYLRNDAETFKPYAFWTAGSIDLTAGSEDGYATIATIRNGLITNLAYFGPNEIYLNYNSDDIDTIIYGANDLFTARVDAGDNAFQVGIVTPGNIADFRSSGVIFNSGEADRDFRIAGNGVTNGVFFDASSSRLGLGTSTPESTLHVSGGSISLDNEYVIQAKDTGGTLRSIFQLNNANNAIIGFGVQSGNSVRIAPGGTARVTIEATTGNVGIGTTAPAASAKLEISSTTGALLLPRMTTTQRNALTAVNGMIIYNTTTGVIEGYEGGAWVNL